MVIVPPPVATATRLYSPGQIALAAFLGSPLAGFWFFATNYRELGNRRAANQCLIWGTIGTLALFAIPFALPEAFPKSVIPAAYTVTFAQTARQIHGAALHEHQAGGGRLGSWWMVVGVSVLCLAVALGLLFGGALIYVLLSPSGAS